MKSAKSIQRIIVALSCVGLLNGQMVRAASPQGTPIRDIALQAGGTLNGQVLNEQGLPHQYVRVALVKQGEAVAVAETDAAGQFAVRGLSAGVYELQSASGGVACRLWAANTAPPAAQPAVLLVPAETITRGQFPGGSMMTFLANPWVLAGLVAAAIAVPLALDSDDDAS